MWCLHGQHVLFLELGGLEGLEDLDKTFTELDWGKKQVLAF